MANPAYSDDISLVKMGNAKIWINSGSGYYSIGACTIDPKTWTYSPEYLDIQVGESGETVRGKRLRKEAMTINFTPLEQKISTILLQYPLITTYSGTGNSYGIGGKIGEDIFDNTVSIYLHPINSLGTNGADDETYLAEDVEFWKCANAKEVTRSYDGGNLNKFALQFDVFPDYTKTYGMYLCLMGDPANTTLDITPPHVDKIEVEKSNVMTEITPAGSALAAVDADTNIQITVSEALDPGSGINKANIVLQESTSDVPITAYAITCAAPYTVIVINPTSNFTTATTYVITVNGLVDTAGNQQTTAFSRQFTIA